MNMFGDPNKKKSGKQLRDEGIKRSVNNANANIYQWSDMAYDYLLKYITTHKEFVTEDVRIASENMIMQPPNTRAWGAIITRAVKNNIIRRKGYVPSNNPKTHRTIITLWEVINS